MCGFCGFTGSIQDRENIIKKMMSKIIHRGPDSEGVHTDEKITMGFRRLSIIGLSDGSQPMYNEDGSLVLVFNGEIYNYKDLREELIKKGHIFKTHADTEVLVHLYEEKGRDMLEDIRGMFAFAIYDKKDDSLFAARDFFGIKPFYYANIDGNMLFGSEIKSFLEYTEFKKEVNPIALENYLTFQYSVLEETFFKGVYKLMPGHFLTFKKGEIKTERYFNPMFLDGDYDKSLHNVVTEVDDVLQDSV